MNPSSLLRNDTVISCAVVGVLWSAAGLARTPALTALCVGLAVVAALAGMVVHEARRAGRRRYEPRCVVRPAARVQPPERLRLAA